MYLDNEVEALDGVVKCFCFLLAGACSACFFGRTMPSLSVDGTLLLCCFPMVASALLFFKES